ncbi:MAG: hypothetical protein II265_01710 [Clostridia bacterium]|nr:hypothetical protein [Clostridia bacterium]MBQ2436785.1 hypothetical protein [Clostridia bacterium]
MAVTAAFLAKVKTALRVSFNNLDSQISDLIEEAILDLTATADIKSFTTSNADALQTGAVISWVSWKWFNDDKFKVAYDDMKAKMAISGQYRSVMLDEE